MQKGDNPARHLVVAEAAQGWRNMAPVLKQADVLARARDVLRLLYRVPGPATRTRDGDC